MKKIALLLIFLMTIVCGADAYIINFDVPSEVNLGDTIVIQGTSTINPGITMTIVLYSQKNTIKEISRKSFTIQSGGTWSVKFETDDLTTGSYKFEIPSTSDVDLGSSSTRYRSFNIIDRTAEIIISSSLTQEYNGYLLVEGRSTTRGNLGIEIMVDSEDKTVLPRKWISTDTSGKFSENVGISAPGTYYVSFYDNNGLIRHQKFTSVMTGQTPVQTAIPSGGSSSQTKPMTAQSFASFESPAYFIIMTEPGNLVVSTSEGHDWVLEYADETRAIKTINQYSDNGAESFTIYASGGTVYVKAYPSDTSDSGYVTLYADGASSITASSDAAFFFEPKATPVPTQSGVIFPIGVISCLIASSILLLSVRRQ